MAILEVKVPSPGESITEVEIGDWLVNDGDYVEMDDELVEINSDKATLTVNAEDDGKVTFKIKSGEMVNVGDIIATIDTDAKAPEGGGGNGEEKKEAPQPEEKPAEKEPATASAETQSKQFASVSAEKMIKEKGIDPAAVKGTGRDGRITKTDVVTYVAKKGPEKPEKNEKESASKSVSKPKVQVPEFSGAREERREKMSMLRRKIAERLVSVKNETAMLTTFNEVDMSGIMNLRKQYKEKFKEQYGVGLGFMSFFTKACTEAIKHFPGINAQIDGEEVIYHDYVDVSIAVSSDRGLVVPVVRNAESMSLAQIESAIMDLAIKARDGKLSIDDMTGGTFSITNGGIFGSMLSTPIINPPQSAILGMHNIVERPVAVNGQVEIRPIMYLALSYDHRIVDGKEAVSFLFKVREMLEDPARMLLGL